jgi:four helix bundle protein
MKDFRELQIWGRSHQVTLDIYQVTAVFPKEELYGMVSQMRRSAASIPTNIAEGCGRDTDADFARFLQIAMGSASELEYQLILAHSLRYLTEADFTRITNELIEVKRMLNAFLKKLRTNSKELTAKS